MAAIKPLGKNILVEVVVDTPKPGEITIPAGKFDLKKVKILEKGPDAPLQLSVGDIIFVDAIGYTVPGNRGQFILNGDDALAVVKGPLASGYLD